MYCGKCGRQIPDGSQVCPECGSVLAAGNDNGSEIKSAFIMSHKMIGIIATAVVIVAAVVLVLVPLIPKGGPGQAAAKYADAQVGDVIHFGHYEQDNDSTNGKEKIEWLVLARYGSRGLVVSRYALDCQRYNHSDSAVTWETCSLRKWLNDEFLNAAFTAEEQARIPTVTVTVTADKNPLWDTDPGNDVNDKIFLLSIPEALNYYASNEEERQCWPTEYAIAQGRFNISDYNGTCRWWLRSPGVYSLTAAYVGPDGGVEGNIDVVYDPCVGVRPALWINLGS